MSDEKRPEPSSQTLALEQIDSPAFQIRQTIDEDRLRELASSMRQRGLLQPILVRPKSDRFEIVAGERRFRAAKLLEWKAIACRVAELSDLDAEVDKLVENEQRLEAKPLERARAFAHLRDAFNLEQEEIARRVGVHKSVVSRTLALLKQPAEIQKMVADESISPGHLRSLEAIADESKRVELAAQAAKEHLSVKETQRRARDAAKSLSTAPSDASIASAPAEIRIATASEAPIARASAQIQKTVADESSSPDPLRAQDAIVEPQPVEAAAQAAKEHRPVTQVERRVREEGGDVSAKASEDAIAKQAAEIPKRVTDESSSAGPLRSHDAIAEPSKPVDVATQAAKEYSAVTEIERRAAGPANSLQAQTIEQRIVNWCIALGGAVRGPWRDALWDFYERMTDVATLWRIAKAVLKLLARLIPGRDPEPTPIMKLANFRNLLPPTNSEAEKPGTNPPKAA